MYSTWLSRIGAGIAVAGAVLIATGGTAMAQPDTTTADLRQSDVTADDPEFDQGFGNCEEKPDQLPNEDIWVFVWPGNDVEELVSLELNFDTDGDGVADTTLTEEDVTETLDQGALKVWVATPAGWTLVDGTSEVVGSVPQNEFNLTHSCAGVPIPPTPTPTPSASPSPTPSPTASPTVTPSPSVMPTGSPGPTTPAPTPTMVPMLPVTGGALGIPVLLGVVLLGAGGGLLLALRRRRGLS